MKNRRFFSGHLGKRKQHREWVANNREKVLAARRAWTKNNPAKIRHYRLRENYGVTLEQYQQIWESQGKLCVICRRAKQVDERDFCLDHNHTTKKARGILCPQCNSGLGYFKESSDSLRQAVEYLERHR